jgi:hypothetical protein
MDNGRREVPTERTIKAMHASTIRTSQGLIQGRCLYVIEVEGCNGLTSMWGIVCPRDGVSDSTGVEFEFKFSDSVLLIQVAVGSDSGCTRRDVFEVIEG